MKTLVVGASGQIGGSIYTKLKSLGIDTQGTYNSVKNKNLLQLDISDLKAVKSIVSSLDVIFIPGAITNVDFCEEKPEETYKVNVLGVKNIIDSISKDCKVIFFSTDFVFDGEKGLYNEIDIPNPISKYGYQKLLAEHYIANHANNFTIIRTNVVYGPEIQGKNFISRLIKNLEAGKEVTIPKDEFGNPTYGPELADRAIDFLLHSKPNGIYHLSGAQLVSRYRFALEAAEIFGCDTKLIKPINSVDLKRLAKRPLSAGLSSIKDLRNMMNYQEGLRVMFKNVRKL